MLSYPEKRETAADHVERDLHELAERAGPGVQEVWAYYLDVERVYVAAAAYASPPAQEFEFTASDAGAQR